MSETIPYKLLDWIDESYIHYPSLCENTNPCAIKLIEARLRDDPTVSAPNQEIISWRLLSKNPAAVDLLKRNPDKIDWCFLSLNPSKEAIPILRANPSKIDWTYMAHNPNVMEYADFIKYLVRPTTKLGSVWRKIKYILGIHQLQPLDDFWFYYNLSKNPAAMPLIEYIYEYYPDRLDWGQLAVNPAAVSLLKRNPQKINWQYLSSNPSPDAIDLLEQNPQKIAWKYLSENPSAIRLLEENPDKINWEKICKNQNAVPLIAKNMHRIKIPVDYTDDNRDFYSAEYLEFHMRYNLLSNPGAGILDILEKHPDIIDYKIPSPESPHGYLASLWETTYWDAVAENPNPEVMKFLGKNRTLLNEINWHNMSRRLSRNPAIFGYDYEAMRENYRDLKEEIVAAAWHPRRVAKWIEAGVELDSL